MSSDTVIGIVWLNLLKYYAFRVYVFEIRWVVSVYSRFWTFNNTRFYAQLNGKLIKSCILNRWTLALCAVKGISPITIWDIAEYTTPLTQVVNVRRFRHGTTTSSLMFFNADGPNNFRSHKISDFSNKLHHIFEQIHQRPFLSSDFFAELWRKSIVLNLDHVPDSSFGPLS